MVGCGKRKANGFLYNGIRLFRGWEGVIDLTLSGDFMMNYVSHFCTIEYTVLTIILVQVTFPLFILTSHHL